MPKRRARSEPKPWKYDWRNPDMVIVTRTKEEISYGSNIWEHKTVELTPEEWQSWCRESMATSRAPTWDKDKTYF